MYLWGESNVGKSCLVENVIGKGMMKYVFEVGDGRFAFDGLRHDYHKIILFEEFDWYQWKHSSRYLKRLLEGRRFSADLKGKTPAMIEWANKPVIMVSNFMLIDDPAIVNRLHIVKAEGKYFENGVQAYVKKEVDEEENVSSQEEEVIELSSEEEVGF